MKTYKIIYESRKVKRNKFSVLALDKKEAKENFKNDYNVLGGNWANVVKIISIEELKEGENINEFFKS